MLQHVELPRELRLPREFAYVQDYLASVDPDLRLRRSAEFPDRYVLERRTRRRPFTNLGAGDGRDFHVSMRDGYIEISQVDPSWLWRPWRMVEVLKTVGADLWEYGGHERFANELEYEEAAVAFTKRMRARSLFRHIGLESYDILKRLQGQRFNNPGLGTAPAS